MLGAIIFVIEIKRWQGPQSFMNYVGSTMRKPAFAIDSTVAQKLKVHK
jgi:hypothetical protein